MKKAAFAAFILLLYLAALVCLSAEYSASHFEVTSYEIKAPLNKPLRLVQLTDLHSNQYGDGNRDLLKSVRDLKPDLIMLTGDMINSGDKSISQLPKLIETLSGIAPVYLCYGNHETDWMSWNSTDLRAWLEEAGATVLEAEYTEIDWGGSTIRIGGYAGYYRAPVMTTSDKEQQKAEMRFADDFENTSAYKLLLNHIPTAWLDWNHLGVYDVDLILCGHYHGGQIRLPWIGGIYAPNIGWFPPYTKGLFQENGSSLVLSAGLGSNNRIPRINNPGELVCIDLVPEK